MNSNKIYLGNLSKSLDPSKLEQLFSAYGAIEEISVPTNTETGEIEGYALITYAKSEAAARALSKNGDEIEGQVITVEVARD